MVDNFDDAATLVMAGDGMTGAATGDDLLDLLHEPGPAQTPPSELPDSALPSESAVSTAESPQSLPVFAVAVEQQVDVPAEGTSAHVAPLPSFKRAETMTFEMDLGEEQPLPGPGTDNNDITAMLVSTNPSTASDIVLDTDTISVGRYEAASVVLLDPRVSNEQFIIHRSPLSSNRWKYELEDRSRNGTLVNKVLLKTARRELRDQDLIEVLPASKVGRAASITYLFQAPSADVEADGPPAKKRRVEGEPATADEVFEGAICAICQEVMHRATSVQPCMHSFCSSCLGIWLKNSLGARLRGCPICRNAVKGVARYHTLDGLIEGLLKAHPSRRRPEDSISDLNSRDPLNDAGYDLSKFAGSSSGRLPTAPTAFAAAPLAGFGAAAIHPAPDPHGESSDEDEAGYADHGVPSPYSDRPDDEEEDSEDEEPAREAPRPNCFHCGSRSWQETSLGPAIAHFTATPIAASTLLSKALTRNVFEQGILQEWLGNQSRTLAQVLASLVEDPNPDGVPAVKVFLTRAPAGAPADPTGLVQMPTGSWRDLPTCKECASGILQAAVYSLRERIPTEELAERARGRSNCWYGRKCRTQNHKPAHAERLNHICEQTRH